MRHRVRSTGLHEDAGLARTFAAFVNIRGDAAVPRRRAEIAALPSKLWRGVPVFEIRCDGPFGRGPHYQFVPERLLWSLIDLSHFTCPFHR